jgi:hypothetical protein
MGALGTSSTGTVYEYSRFGFEFRAYPNRIEIKQRSLLFWKRETILVKSIVDVELVGIGRTALEIKTIDGKKHRYTLGVHAEEARAKLMELL